MIPSGQFASALSRDADPGRAAESAARQIADKLGRSPTLVALFATPDLMSDAEAVLDGLATYLEPSALIGCSGEAIIADGREIEDPPALAMWAADIESEVATLDLAARPHEDGVEIVGLPEDLADGSPMVIMLADPFTFPADAALALLAEKAPGVPVVGGLASGGRAPGEHRLLIDREIRSDGAVAVVVEGDLAATVVSQGCRPVGPDMVITAADGPAVQELASKPALDRLRELIDDADEDEREALSGGLLAGLVIDENQPDYTRGDYLVRGVRGADQEQGTLLVGERVRVGQTMRFQVRDARSAHVDLRDALRAGRRSLEGDPGGALIFSCNGRGSHLFDEPDHDATSVANELGDIPAVGLFCNGEIGPVGGHNFLHGFTATLAVFSSGE